MGENDALSQLKTLNSKDQAAMRGFLNNGVTDQPDSIIFRCQISPLFCPRNCANCDFAIFDHEVFVQAMAEAQNGKYTTVFDVEAGKLCSAPSDGEPVTEFVHFFPQEDDRRNPGIFCYHFPPLG